MEKLETSEKIKTLQKQSSYLNNKRASSQKYLERMMYENREYVTLSGIMKACVPFNIAAAVGAVLIKQQPIGVMMAGLCAVTLVNITFTLKKIRKDNSDGDPDKEYNFYILKHTQCPAVLTENFF